MTESKLVLVQNQIWTGFEVQTCSELVLNHLKPVLNWFKLLNQSQTSFVRIIIWNWFIVRQTTTLFLRSITLNNPQKHLFKFLHFICFETRRHVCITNYKLRIIWRYINIITIQNTVHFCLWSTSGLVTRGMNGDRQDP